MLFALMLGSAWAAETTPSRIPSSSPTQRPPATKSGSRGPLPDPVLLDGSTLPAEKKSEHGMIGDFELPGDDSRSGKVGGQQGQPPPQGGGGQQANNMPMGLPAGGGAQGQQSQQGGQPAGAQGGAQSAQSGQQQAGGAQAGGAQNAPGGNSSPNAGDPNAQAQGIQVAELGGDAAGQQQGGGAAGPGEKPSQVAIGDSAMRIDPSSAQAGVVGGQQQQAAGHTQQHEKGTGSGGKGAGGAGSGNRVEKGRAIPAGL